jgi:predicted metal-dependent peptidase
MDIAGALGKARKLARGHQKQVDEALNKAANLAKEHAPSNVDKIIDQANQKAEEEF